ncbi:outer membrane protein assembly factor BamA [Wenxinia saemankumensis]|nr:outer membrane protein assembly factor BamA [Wenxinia saemankumensis]
MITRRGRRAAVLAGTVSAALWAGTAAGQTYAFNDVVVNGNVALEDATILSYLGISRGEAVTAGQLNDGIQAIRNTGLFASVDAVPQGGTLVLNVQEFPTIGRIAFEGNSRLSDEELLALVSGTARRVYNPANVEADALLITEEYARRGRINATVRPVLIERENNVVDVVYEIAEGGVSEIERISFVGNRSFSDARLRGVLETKQAGLLRQIIQRDVFDPARFEFDQQVLRDFYQSRGYVDMQITGADVSLTAERDAYLITFNIQEGQQFRIGNVTVSSEIPEADVADYVQAIRPREGQVYSPQFVDENIERLERLGARNGVPFLTVEPRITRNDRALALDIDYALVRGERVFVERIDIEGNNTTLDRVVRNQFRTVEGDPLNRREIQDSAERIRALGYFADVAVDTRPGSAPDQAIVDVNVVEQPTGSLSFGANFNSDNGVSLVASFAEANFLGRGQGLSFSLQAGRESQVLSFDFSEPNFLNRDLRFGFEASYTNTDNEESLYDTREFRLSPSFQFPISDYGRLGVYYAADFTEIVNVSDSASPLIQAEAAEGGLWTQSVGYSYSWDTRRSGFDSRSDFAVRFGQEFGFGDRTFIETTGMAMAQTRVLQEDVVLRATLEGGLLSYQDGRSRVTDRYFLNGTRFRGFEFAGIGPRDADTLDALGGESYAVLRLETEFPLGLPEEYGISGGAFVNYGSVWDVGDTRSLTEDDILYNDFTARATAGLTVFWDTPIGPLRFDFSEPIQIEDEDRARNFDVSVATRF